MGLRRSARTPVLDVAYLESGPASGPPVVLLHGFPYDVRSYRMVQALLADHGARVIVPWLRGYGPTRFLREDTMRSGQQAALGRDLVELLDALDIARAVVGGYDWGGRAACIAAALHPERVAGLVTVDGYNIQNLARASTPAPPAAEKELWYQHYFQTDRGRDGLERYRDELCGMLWRDWSPTWADAEAAFAESAESLRNPDFVDVVIHSYRHRRGNAPGDSAYEEDERALARQPAITVPTVALTGRGDGLGFEDPEVDRPLFTGGYQTRILDGVGHNPPQEAPEEFAAAVLSLL